MKAGASVRATSSASAEARHRGREAAVQMLYQWEVGGVAMPVVRETFWDLGIGEMEAAPESVRGFAMALATGTADRIAELDPLISEAAAHWRLERMAIIDRLILRLAVYEFLQEPGTPATVIINEALELGRSFTGDTAVPFINGVLDAIRRKLERA